MPIRTLWTEPDLRKLAKLWNVLADKGTPDKQREAFRLKVETMLRAHGCNDRIDVSNTELFDLLKQAKELLEREDRERSARNASPPPQPPANAPPPPPGGAAPQNAEDLFLYICEILERGMYLRMAEYRPAIAAWVMHAWKFRCFRVTPRLHIKSAVFGEGKTTLFDILEQLVPNPERDDNTTAAAVADLANQEPPSTLLLDEADNLGLMDDPIFKAVLNAGYHCSGRRTVMGPKGRRISKNLFAPMALASIRNLPGPLMRRSIVIEMRRAPSEVMRNLIAFDKNDPQYQEMFKDVRVALRHWAYHAQANPNPEMPPELPTLPRQAWAPLVACGDACGAKVSAMVRAAAVTIAGSAEEPRLLALGHLFEIFNTPLDDTDNLIVPSDKHARINTFKEQLTTDTVIQTLRQRYPIWEAWTGESGHGLPHAITPGEFARLFHDWHVRPKVLWSPEPKDIRVSARGWKYADLVKLFVQYEVGDPGVTPSHTAQIVNLPRHAKRHTRDGTG